MANEAVIIELYGNAGDVRQVTVASGLALTKGALLNLTDPNTASGSALTGEPLSGIAAADKTTDYSTTIGVITNAKVDMYASGVIAVGMPVMSIAAYPNYVYAASGAAGTVASGASILGYALETSTNGEVIAVRVRL